MAKAKTAQPAAKESAGPEPTHMFMTDVIVCGIGKCSAGTRCSAELIKDEAMWTNLVNDGLVRPIEEVEQELEEGQLSDADASLLKSDIDSSSLNSETSDPEQTAAK